MYRGKSIYQPNGAAYEYCHWACNLFNGCRNNCEYCLEPNTEILMFDGSVKKLSDVEIGDELYGFEGKDHARLSKSVVTNKVYVIKDAYEINLSNGVKLICSEDHRWLSNRGWKYTIGAETGKLRRPFLTPNNRIYGFSDFNMMPKFEVSDLYRRGYLFGMISGDANFKAYPGVVKTKGESIKTTFYRFRLALVMSEAVERSKEYLEDFGVKTVSFKFPMKDRTIKEIVNRDAIRASSKDAYERIKELITIEDDIEFRRGFVAGFYDAEGSAGQTIRISNTDKSLLDLFVRSIDEHGFRYCYERTKVRDGQKKMYSVRVGSRLRERLRFVKVFNPSMRALRDITGIAVNAFDEEIKVLSIRRLGEEMEMIDISTTTENFIANGMVSHNCYNKHSMASGVLGAEEVSLKKSLVDEATAFEIFKKELSEAKQLMLPEDSLFFSFVSDPMLPENVPLTMRCVALALENNVSIQILTKCSDWVEDKNILHILGKHKGKVKIGFTLTGMEEMESLCLNNTDERIQAMGLLKSHGIETFASVEPVIDIDAALSVIEKSKYVCDMFKIGLVSKMGIKFEKQEVMRLVSSVKAILGDRQVMFKDSVKRHFQ